MNRWNMNKVAWLNPTVLEVENVLFSIADKYGLEDFKAVHSIVGVSDRTLRRWRGKADSEPLNASNIPFLASVSLWSILNDEFVLDGGQNVRSQIPNKYITDADNYICPPVDFLKSLVGKNNLLGWTIRELSEYLKCSYVQLGADIKREKVSYLTFCTILMFCGFTPKEVFGLSELNKSNDKALNLYEKEKDAIRVEYELKLQNLALRYITDFPELKNII